MTTKEKGAAPFEATPLGTTAPDHRTTTAAENEVPRGVYHPLSWRPEHERKAKLPRGKGRRNARRDAINAKRHQGGIGTFDVLASIALFGWLATVLLWAWETLL